MKLLYTGISLIATVYFLEFFGIEITEEYEAKLYERCKKFDEDVDSSLIVKK